MRVPEEFRRFPAALRAAAPFGPWRAVVKRVVDGDTLDVLVDQGFNEYRYLTIRLAGIDAPELYRGSTRERARAAQARDHLARLCLGRCCVIHTKPDAQSFGRYVARVVLEDGTDVGAQMVADGHAVASRR